MGSDEEDDGYVGADNEDDSSDDMNDAEYYEQEVGSKPDEGLLNIARLSKNIVVLADTLVKYQYRNLVT